MKIISFVIIICAAIVSTRGSFEQFNEQAWMDKQSKDKYFEYSELTAPVDAAENRVDPVEFQKTKTKVRVRMKRLITNLSTNFINLCLQKYSAHVHIQVDCRNIIQTFLM